MKKAFALFILSAIASANYSFAQRQGAIRKAHQKVIIFMIDGFGESYYRASDMPTLNGMEKKGIYKIVPSLMPSVTNLNNASICTGQLPEKNGITGNSYYDVNTGTEEFMEDSVLLLSPTIFQRAKKQGIKSALFSSKKKTTGLLANGADLVLSPETASEEWIRRIGTAPSIYSREVNYWLMEAALYTMKHDSAINLFYIHTTDYPMHTWAPEENESKEHLHQLDGYIQQIKEAEPDAMILITADHTVNHKSLCVDLEKICSNKNLPLKIAISAERDKYVKHHRGFGGTSYVYLNSMNDLPAVKKILLQTKGVETVLTSDEAAKKFHLLKNRIGDLVVLGDKNTVFGNLDSEYEELPANYRSHGSMYEAAVPVFIYNAKNHPAPSYFSSNYKIAAWLFP
ncbi:MAG: alkaline phosphatase family protein [Chitinophagaceae bacterium]